MPNFRSKAALVAGLVAGIVAAASGLRDVPDDLPEHAVARINQRLILRDAWLRAVTAVAADRRTPLTPADKQEILQRLVDEELLVQHGLALGLVEQDRRLRGQLLADVIAMSNAESAADGVSDDAVERYYRAHPEFFAVPARLRVAAWRIPLVAGAEQQAQARATALAARLRRGLPDAAGGAEGFLPPVPDALLPPGKLKTYLGPALTLQALSLRPGEVSEPTRHGDQFVVLQVLELEPGVVPPLAEIREQVRSQVLRRADERALHRLLQDLRESAAVRIRRNLE